MRLSGTDELPAVAARRGLEPKQLSGQVRGELDWVVMKCLEKDRNRRYETAAAFAADLRRYLADEPVQACPPSAAYRLRKFARRNRPGLAVAVLVLFFLVLLGGGIGWAPRDREARHARAGGQVELTLAEVDQLEGEQKWPEALAAARRAGVVVTGGEADVETAERVRARLKDLGFIDRLEQIRMQRATWIGGTFDDAGADQDYTRAFRDYGVDVEALAAQASIDRLKVRPALVVPLAAALDEWLRARWIAKKNDSAGRERLAAVARGIDPDSLRDRLRSPRPYHASEVQELRRLADSINVRAQHPATIVSMARTLHRAKYSDASLRLLTNAQYVYPGDYWLNFTLGSVLSNQKDPEGAIRFYTAAASIRPNSYAAYVNLGNALRDQGKLDDAVAACRKAIELDPKLAVAYANLGFALREQKRLDEAVTAFHKAIELDPQYAVAHIGLGMALRNQKKLDEAIIAYHKAIELDPKLASAYVNLGIALRDQGKLHEAVTAYHKAIKFDPKYAPAHVSLGALLCDELNDYDKAIECFRKAIQLDPKNASAYACLRVGLAKKAWHLVNIPEPKRRDPEGALAAIKEAIDLDPKSELNWQYLGWIQYRTGKWRASIQALEKSCKLHRRGTGDSGQWIVLALAHARLAAQEDLAEMEREHHRTEARRWFEKADGLINRWLRVRPSGPVAQAIWDFREEARELFRVEKKD
jgi:tetratricopeptide (TPR) repeat protein